MDKRKTPGGKSRNWKIQKPICNRRFLIIGPVPVHNLQQLLAHEEALQIEELPHGHADANAEGEKAQPRYPRVGGFVEVSHLYFASQLSLLLMTKSEISHYTLIVKSLTWVTVVAIRKLKRCVIFIIRSRIWPFSNHVHTCDGTLRVPDR